MQKSLQVFRFISDLFVLPVYKMNNLKPGFFFVYLLTVVFVKMADTGKNEDSDDGIINIYIYILRLRINIKQSRLSYEQTYMYIIN